LDVTDLTHVGDTVMAAHGKRSSFRGYLHAWYTYGTINRKERVTHALIAAGSVLAMVFCGLLFSHPHWLAWSDRVSPGVSKRFDPKSFAYVMTIMTSLIAAVCTAFSAILYGSRDAVGDPSHSLSHVTALVVSLLAAIAATFGFAATYAATPPPRVDGVNVPGFFMLVMSFIQLAISTGIVGITLIPIVNNRKDQFVDPLIKAISTIWWLPAGWLFLFLLAMPGVFGLVMPMLLFLLSATMAQAFFPHGVYVERSMKAYKALLWRYASFGFVVLTICTIVAGLCIILSLAIPQPPQWFYVATIDGVFGAVGVSMWFYSVFIEGIRKVDKIAFAKA
jgi:hypothetical protein